MRFLDYSNVGYKWITDDTQLGNSLQRKIEKVLICYKIVIKNKLHMLKNVIKSNLLERY